MMSSGTFLFGQHTPKKTQIFFRSKLSYGFVNLKPVVEGILSLTNSTLPFIATYRSCLNYPKEKSGTFFGTHERGAHRSNVVFSKVYIYNFIVLFDSLYIELELASKSTTV